MNTNEQTADHDLLMRFKRAQRRFAASYLGKRYKIQITGILRTDEEQKNLWWKSREMKDGKIVQAKNSFGILIPHVTYIDGVVDRSKHQANKEGFSEAIDFAPVNKKTGKIDWMRILPFTIFGWMCEKEGLFWGGRWAFRDYGHIEILK